MASGNIFEFYIMHSETPVSHCQIFQKKYDNYGAGKQSIPSAKKLTDILALGTVAKSIVSWLPLNLQESNTPHFKALDLTKLSMSVRIFPLVV